MAKHSTNIMNLLQAIKYSLRNIKNVIFDGSLEPKKQQIPGI